MPAACDQAVECVADRHPFVAPVAASPEEARDRFFDGEPFRPGQREAIAAVLAGRDAMVLMPTGSGKSRIFQAAALLLSGTTLVVSPLLALMRDQVAACAHVVIQGWRNCTAASRRPSSAR